MGDSPITIERTTKETSINLSLDFSVRKDPTFDFNLPFFAHILHAMAFHGEFSLQIRGGGDLEVDFHHFVEDVGLVFGEALKKTVDEYGPVQRFGHAVIPMDDALSEVTIDVSGRPFIRFESEFPQSHAGTFDMSLIREFLAALANRANIALHAHCRYGLNSHHMAESLFKAIGKALAQAYSPVSQGAGPKSTKGLL